MRYSLRDLDRDWRGGQSQALLTLRGLRDSGHEVTLLARKSLAARHPREGAKI